MSIVEDTILGTCTYNYNGLGTRVSTNITTPIDTIQSEYYYDITREHHNLIMLEYVDKHQKYFGEMVWKDLKKNIGKAMLY